MDPAWNFSKCEWCFKDFSLKEFYQKEKGTYSNVCRRCDKILHEIRGLINQRNSSGLDQKDFEIERNILLQKADRKLVVTT